MEFKIGTKVRIKGINEFPANVISAWSGAPVWADSRQADYYGSDKIYTVKESSCYKRSYSDSTEYYIRLEEIPYSWTAEDLVVVEQSEKNPEYDIGDVVVTEIYGEECPSIITAVIQRRGHRTRYEIDDGKCAENNEIIGIWDGEGEIPEKRYCSRCENFYVLYESDNICREDRNLCPKCRERKFITPYHAYTPALNFHKTDSDDADENLFYGVELEVDGGGETNAYAIEVMDILNEESKFVYCSHDGSLNSGFEIITQPATLSYHKAIEGTYKKAFRKLIQRGYRSHDTNTAGIHVHFSRDYYAENEEDNIAKLLYLVEKFWDEIVIFSRRDYRTLERYAKKINSNPNEFVKSWNKSESHDGHYFAVNISNPYTIELRMFRGTLNYNTYAAILEFVDSIVRVAKEKTISELQQLEFESILTPLCLEYYMSRKAGDKFSETSTEPEQETILESTTTTNSDSTAYERLRRVYSATNYSDYRFQFDPSEWRIFNVNTDESLDEEDELPL